MILIFLKKYEWILIISFSSKKKNFYIRFPHLGQRLVLGFNLVWQYGQIMLLSFLLSFVVLSLARITRFMLKRQQHTMTTVRSIPAAIGFASG